MTKLLFDRDHEVANWVWAAYRIRPVNLDNAIGVLDAEGNVVGAILLSNYNGFNIEFGYYGENTFTLGLIRYLAALGVQRGLSRATMMISKRNRQLLRFLPKIGARLEGVSRCYYGIEDKPRHTAVRFALFRHDMIRIAGLQASKQKVA